MIGCEIVMKLLNFKVKTVYLYVFFQNSIFCLYSKKEHDI